MVSSYTFTLKPATTIFIKSILELFSLSIVSVRTIIIPSSLELVLFSLLLTAYPFNSKLNNKVLCLSLNANLYDTIFKQEFSVRIFLKLQMYWDKVQTFRLLF